MFQTNGFDRQFSLEQYIKAISSRLVYSDNRGTGNAVTWSRSFFRSPFHQISFADHSIGIRRRVAYTTTTNVKSVVLRNRR